MPSAKEIRGRIKSVRNTRKITRAMELISTVKMKKAQDAAGGARPFALAVLRSLSRLSDAFSAHPFFRAPEGAQKTLVVVFAANKGLCGAYNVNVFREVARLMRENPAGTLDFVTVGKKARDFAARAGASVVADFSESFRDAPDPRETRKASRLVQNLWLSGEYSSVASVYSWYVSAIAQKAVRMPLFPLTRERLEEFLLDAAGSAPESGAEEYAFDPSPAAVAAAVAPMAADHILHEQALEAKAGEHAARMVAMKAAKDNAGKKVAALTLAYNKARQGAITKEITEIVSGVESLKD